MVSFDKILTKYRSSSFSQQDKGERFERLMQTYLRTDPKYTNLFRSVWLWNEFPGKLDLGGNDTGIDLVALTYTGDYWAIQCKCYQETSVIDKPAVDSFLSTSSREFKNEELKTTRFSQRLWISTTNKWGPNATEAIKNQHPPVTRINLFDLREAPVDWEKLEEGVHGEVSRLAKKTPRKHQLDAVAKTNVHFVNNDRGKLIMACGTGKTYTSLCIAEKETNGRGTILFLVPSIALLGQSLREWSAEAKEPINAICICSDPEISKKRIQSDDGESISVVDLAWPASTNSEEILRQFKLIESKSQPGMTVVFSTYQSIEVIARAQQVLLNNGFPEFDLIICDEAHRTTGVTLAGEDESAFTKVHKNEFLKAKKRLYMTATPRLYDDTAKSKAAQADAILCSMDRVDQYGEEIYRIGFGQAVELDLLTDYKVLILTLSDQDVPPAVQNMIANGEYEINSDDVSKLVGCINALSKQMLGEHGILKETDPDPMRRAIAFCPNIDTSKKITSVFNTAAETYLDALPEEKRNCMVAVSSRHIDGTMTAPVRDDLIGWLKSDGEDQECRVLTNVRCLSEGVDVPSLDAVLFLSARNSQVDVVQSVGRVMRKADNKKYGYIIIPIVVPADVEAEVALDDNERYKVVWTVLNALRAHDDRFNAIVNKIELNKKRPDQILIGRPEVSFDTNGNPFELDDTQAPQTANDIGRQIALQFQALQHVIFARMVKKVGDKRYWEQWAKDIALIAERQIERINFLITDGDGHQEAFENFLKGLQTNINPGISAVQAVEMLAQHIITEPVFDALFEGYSFVKNNAVSRAMQTMLDSLQGQTIVAENEALQKFYDSVRKRAADIDNAAGKQRIIIELYDKFFKTAFPKMVEQLGIVYTPVEVVDFIIHSVNNVLKQEFGRQISDENIHILDPFTGTGTFITRLLQSGLISSSDLERKYRYEIHANEIVLLAYYIAAVNIENAYHDKKKRNLDIIENEKILSKAAINEIDSFAIAAEPEVVYQRTTQYEPFDGICLTDTFQLGEFKVGERLFSDVFSQNSARVERQLAAPLRVIIGNPPYSIGQKSANDNARNQAYPKLDKRVADTYAKESDATSVKALYDAYIKAFRWATDRLGEDGGIIAFITNSGWLEKGGSDGMRRCFQDEFSSIHVFNLRGAIKGKSGEAAKREGQNVFDIMTGVAITILVKNPQKRDGLAEIYYSDIGDYLSRKDKLNILGKQFSITNENLPKLSITPNRHADWLNHRSDSFSTLLPIDANKKYDLSSQSFFLTHSLGLATGRDSWVYNFSTIHLIENVELTITAYNQQVADFKIFRERDPKGNADDFIDNDTTKISWNRNLKQDLEKFKLLAFNKTDITTGLHRPFCKNRLYFNKDLTAMLYQNRRLFPTPLHKNIIICVSGLNTRLDNTSVLISNVITDLNCLDAGTQCFPMYYYEENTSGQKNLFDSGSDQEYIRKDAISDFILVRARHQYGKNISKEDIFYYVYGYLQQKEYRKIFANDLKKSLPRIAMVDDVRDFWAFSKAGRVLATLHLDYENVPGYEHVSVTGEESGNFIVDKMRFEKGTKNIIILNSKISIKDIPSKAFEYIINGKSAIEWVMERYQVTTHKESGITNNPNDWAIETGAPRFVLDLLLSVINVSVQTVDIVNSLPDLNFDLIENTIDFDQNIDILDELLSDHEPQAQVMREFSLNEGIYFIADVVQITQLNRDKVSRWFKELSKENYEGLTNSQQNDTAKMRISFYGLIELVVIGTLRDAGFTLKKILTARQDLKNITHKIYPFATNNVRDDLKVAGNAILFELTDGVVTLNGTSQFNLDIIKTFFANIEFDTEGLAQQLFPVKDSKLIVVDPKLGGGKAVINNGGGVWAETIASAYDGPDSIAMLESQYDVTKADVLAAVSFLN